MAVYWTTEVLPMAVTGLIPMLLFPLFELVKPADLSVMYFKEIMITFIGGLILALAIERWNLHKRIALRILLWMGTELRWLLAGFMVTTAFLSMWVGNAAVAAMMLPIVQAVLEELVNHGKNEMRKPTRKESKVSESTNEKLSEICSGETPDVELAQHEENGEAVVNATEKEEPTRFDYESLDVVDQDKCKMFYLCIAYSSNIGGVAVITGNGPSIVFKGFIDQLSEGESVVTFGSWILFNIPSATICLVLAWFWLQIYFLGWRSLLRWGKSKSDDEQVKPEKTKIQKEYAKLGRVTFPEKAVLVHFVVQVLLWLLLDPGIFPGYGSLFKKG